MAICAVAVAAVIFRVVMWWARDTRRALVSSDTFIGVRVGTKTVFETPWTDIASITLERGDSLAQLMLSITGGFSTYPHFTTTSPDRWSGSMSPELVAFLPKDYQLLTAALAEECRRRSVPFSYD
ncbi:hypothetical protein [Aeromicrobium sp. P5_D10]